jgi:hypothetical protein
VIVTQEMPGRSTSRLPEGAENCTSGWFAGYRGDVARYRANSPRMSSLAMMVRNQVRCRVVVFGEPAQVVNLSVPAPIMAAEA